MLFPGPYTANNALVLNDARHTYNIPEFPDVGNPIPKRSHATFWNAGPIHGAVRRLQIQPSHPQALAMLTHMNSDIAALNRRKNYDQICGQFPIQYLLQYYEMAQDFRKTYRESSDSDRKKEIAVLFENVYEATVDFCKDHRFPDWWAWQYADITKEPRWLSQDAPGHEPDPDDESDGDEDMEMVQAMSHLTLSREPILAQRSVAENTLFLVQESSGMHVWKSAELDPDTSLDRIPKIEAPSKQFKAEHRHRYKGLRWIAMTEDNAVIPGIGQFPTISVMVEWTGDLEDTIMWRSHLNQIVKPDQVDKDVYRFLPYRKKIQYDGRDVYIMALTPEGLSNGEDKAEDKIKRDRRKTAKAARSVPPPPPAEFPPVDFNQAGSQAQLPAGFAQSFPQLAYTQTMQPPYTQPMQPAYTQPMQPPYTQPMQPPYNQPMQPPYNQPMQPAYTQPVQPGGSQGQFATGFAQQNSAQPGATQPMQPGLVQSGFTQAGSAPFMQPAFGQTSFSQPGIPPVGFGQGAGQPGVRQPAFAQGAPQPPVAQGAPQPPIAQGAPQPPVAQGAPQPPVAAPGLPPTAPAQSAGQPGVPSQENLQAMINNIVQQALQQALQQPSLPQTAQPRPQPVAA